MVKKIFTSRAVLSSLVSDLVQYKQNRGWGLFLTFIIFSSAMFLYKKVKPNADKTMEIKSISVITTQKTNDES